MPSIPEQLVLRGLHLTRGFGDGAVRKLALNDVSLDLQAGRFALLMGPSGSGKSTLLAVLSGLLQPDSGQVLIRDRGDLTDLWSLNDHQREQLRLRQCGFVFQGYNLFPSLTARQQVEIVLKWGEGIGSADARRRADEMLDVLGLGDRARCLPSQLSGGEKQRVAIARALVKRPAVLFADEPTSALDWGHGQRVVDLLRSAAHEHGTAVLSVSHDARLVPFVDEVYRLEDGILSDPEPNDSPSPSQRTPLPRRRRGDSGFPLRGVF